MTEIRTIRKLRREALGQDALLFSGAFTAGAAVYFIGRAIHQALSGGDGSDFWSISLSDDLILSGLIAGELFLVWNNGLRQGLRGHSIGKHRVGLAVVDVDGGRPTGAARGLARGLLMAVLLDLAVAAIPIGLPTVLRRLTPESWHFGGAAYLALLVLLVPLLVTTDRGFADRIVRSKVVQGSGPDAVIAPDRQRALVALDVVGVLGVLAVALSYIVYFSPLLRFPHLF
ncbi:hypothetical protein [Aeromicrobium sp.]|uniref:hypothetical protein n=1 Tax=Aeromicrobium sp. TaxID=1871063 RepID=UPI0019AB545B|nr:hypothetical protein [Aeromicrobium sp.]MBC7633236.1 RDD family protein [Aeromicrobium sp.]